MQIFKIPPCRITTNVGLYFLDMAVAFQEVMGHNLAVKLDSGRELIDQTPNSILIKELTPVRPTQWNAHGDKYARKEGKPPSPC